MIIDESPYYDNSGRGNEAERKVYDADGKIAKFPLFYDNYFVPRGYAVLNVDMLGTTRSDGLRRHRRQRRTSWAARPSSTG